MSDFRHFAERLHSLRTTQQRQEEAKLLSAAHDQRRLVEQVAATADARGIAGAARNDQATGRDVTAWHDYVRALEAQQRRTQDQLATATNVVHEQRTRVRTAYQEARRWQMVADRLRTGEVAAEQSRQQKEADELAVQRVNRELGR